MRYISLCLLCLFVLSSVTAWADIVIIANENIPETTIAEKDLQEIFLGKRVQWKDNTAIHPVMIRDQPLHETFLQQYMKKSSSKWNAYWKRMVFTGNGMPPKQFGTELELLEYVVTTKGAIGYVDAETPIKNVTIIEVQ